MSNEFIREARYVVLKSADVMKCLTVSELIELRRIQAKVEEHRAEIGKPPLDCVVVESDWPEYEPTWRAIEARATGAQPVPSFADAYQGAMEEVAIWKKRALEAEDLNRKFIAEINGPTHMGEPVQPAPSVPDGWLRAINEDIGVANADDTYEQARAKLDSLIGFHVDIATDPAVNGGWKLVPIEPTEKMINEGACASTLPGPRYIDSACAKQCWANMLAAAPEAKPCP